MSNNELLIIGLLAAAAYFWIKRPAPATSEAMPAKPATPPPPPVFEWLPDVR